MKTKSIQIEQSTYLQAKEILNQIGLNYSQVISAFNNMIISNKGLPFEIPTLETEQALNQLKNRDELFKN